MVALSVREVYHQQHFLYIPKKAEDELRELVLRLL